MGPLRPATRRKSFFSFDSTLFLQSGPPAVKVFLPAGDAPASRPPPLHGRAGAIDRTRSRPPPRRGAVRRLSSHPRLLGAGRGRLRTASPPGQAPGPGRRGSPTARSLFDNPVVGRYEFGPRAASRLSPSGAGRGSREAGREFDTSPDADASRPSSSDGGPGGRSVRASGILHTQFHAPASRDAGRLRNHEPFRMFGSGRGRRPRRRDAVASPSGPALSGERSPGGRSRRLDRRIVPHPFPGGGGPIGVVKPLRARGGCLGVVRNSGVEGCDKSGGAA